MNYSFEELEQALQIDLNNLDEARVNHVQLFYAVSKGYRSALDARDRVKKDQKEIYGEKYFEAKNLVETEHGKSTEALIKAQLDILSPCKDINSALLQTEVDLNAWTALRDAYEQRSFALSSLIELYLAGYFGTVSAEVVSPKSKDNRANDRLEKLEQLRRRKQKTA
jgi:hypothetical protein